MRSVSGRRMNNSKSQNARLSDGPAVPKGMDHIVITDYKAFPGAIRILLD